MSVTVNTARETILNFLAKYKGNLKAAANLAFQEKIRDIFSEDTDAAAILERLQAAGAKVTLATETGYVDASKLTTGSIIFLNNDAGEDLIAMVATAPKSENDKCRITICKDKAQTIEVKFSDVKALSAIVNLVENIIPLNLKVLGMVRLEDVLKFPNMAISVRKPILFGRQLKINGNNAVCIGFYESNYAGSLDKPIEPDALIPLVNVKMMKRLVSSKMPKLTFNDMDSFTYKSTMQIFAKYKKAYDYLKTTENEDALAILNELETAPIKINEKIRENMNAYKKGETEILPEPFLYILLGETLKEQDDLMGTKRIEGQSFIYYPNKADSDAPKFIATSINQLDSAVKILDYRGNTNSEMCNKIPKVITNISPAVYVLAHELGHLFELLFQNYAGTYESSIFSTKEVLDEDVYILPFVTVVLNGVTYSFTRKYNSQGQEWDNEMLRQLFNKEIFVLSENVDAVKRKGDFGYYENILEWGGGEELRTALGKFADESHSFIEYVAVVIQDKFAQGLEEGKVNFYGVNLFVEDVTCSGVTTPMALWNASEEKIEGNDPTIKPQ